MYLISHFPFASGTSAAASPLCPPAHGFQLLSFEPVPIRFSSQPFIPLSLLLARITCDSKTLNPIINALSLYDLTYHSGLLHPP